MTTDSNQNYNFPRLNEKAPSFEARTTHGMKKLSDYEENG